MWWSIYSNFERMLSNQCEMDVFFPRTKSHVDHRFLLSPHSLHPSIHSIFWHHIVFIVYAHKKTRFIVVFHHANSIYFILFYFVWKILYIVIESFRCAIFIQLIKWMCSAAENINWFSKTIWLWIMTMNIAFYLKRWIGFVNLK